MAVRLLVAFAATSAATWLPNGRPGRVVDSHLRLRGGEAPPSGSTTRNALTRDEITEKLNAVPVFCIVNEKGGLIGTRSKDGKEAVCWFTDAAESKALLAVMREHNPDVDLRLGVYGLGTVFRLCKGWSDEESPAMQSESTERFAGELRLQGNMPLMNETAPRLKEMLHDAGIDAGTWQLPIFLCEQLQSGSILPVFFSPVDLAATWEKSGRKKEEMPDEIAMMDLRILVAQMETDTNPWRIVQFVSSPQAYELVRELQGGAAAAAAAAEDSEGDLEEEEMGELYST